MATLIWAQRRAAVYLVDIENQRWVLHKVVRGFRKARALRKKLVKEGKYAAVMTLDGEEAAPRVAPAGARFFLEPGFPLPEGTPTR